MVLAASPVDQTVISWSERTQAAGNTAETQERKFHPPLAGFNTTQPHPAKSQASVEPSVASKEQSYGTMSGNPTV